MTKVCFDRILPRDLARPRALSAIGSRLRAISPLNKQWPNGSVLSVAFIGGTTQQRDAVIATMPKWSSKCNIEFEFRSLSATIRIAFDQNDGSWSYVGTDNLEIPSPYPTMNFGWLDEAVILHETGHALGLAHEHQNPTGGIIWNEQAVIDALSGPPNYWDETTIRHNVLNKYSVDQILGTEFDRESIMLYSFPASWTLNGVSTPFNTAISAKDAAFVSSPKMYPFEVVPPAPSLEVKQGLAGSIGVRGELDEYEFEVTTSGVYVIETLGTTDVYLSLYRGQTLIAADDDSGRGTNSRIEAQLSPGTYRATVRHFSRTGTGPYRIIVWS